MELGTKSKLPDKKSKKPSGNLPSVLVGFGVGVVLATMGIRVGWSGVGGVLGGCNDVVGPNRFGFGGDVSLLIGYSFAVGIVDGIGVDPGVNVGDDR